MFFELDVIRVVVLVVVLYIGSLRLKKELHEIPQRVETTKAASGSIASTAPS